MRGRLQPGTRLRRWRGPAAALAVLLAAGSATGQSSNPAHAPTASDYGGVGLMQTRSARFQPDGTLDVSVSLVQPYRRYMLNFQPLPWAEATFRYTDIRNRLYSPFPEFSGDQSFKDRGGDLKLLLLRESEYIPQIAVGFQDGLGTGLFQSEYLVFSKRWYDLDVHFGFAWGQMGSRGGIKNPLTLLSDSFRTRSGFVGGEDQGGTFNLGSFFSGEEIGVFGGIEWATPVRGLNLKIEYDGNSYAPDPLNNRLEVDSPVNVGVVYRPFPWIELAAGWERGNTAMFRGTLRADLQNANFPKVDPPPPQVTVRPRPTPAEAPRGRPAPAAGDGDGEPEAGLALAPVLPLPLPPAPPEPEPDLAALLFDGLEARGYEVSEIDVSDGDARVHVRRRPGDGRPAALQETAEALAASLPAAVQSLTLVEHGGGTPRQATAHRTAVDQEAIVDFLFEELAAEGYDLHALELTHDAVEVRVTTLPGVEAQDAARAAGVLLHTLPVPVREFRIVRMEAGIDRQRVVVRRAEAERAAQVDDLYDGLEASGFTVEMVDFARGQATVYVEAHGTTSRHDLEHAARLVADRSPEPVDYVAVVGLSAGIETMRVTLRRQDRSVVTAGADSPAPAVEVTHDLSEAEKQAIAATVFEDLDKEFFTPEAFHLTRFKATAFVTPTRFRQVARNVGRAARVVANHVPDSVELIEIVTMNHGLEIARVTVVRRDLENAMLQRGSAEEIFAHADIDTPHAGPPPFGTIPADAIANPARYPNFTWSLRPALRESIGGPEGFILYQAYLALTARAELYRGLSVSAGVGKNISNNFDRIRQRSDSVLPHVRSDIASYLQEGADGNISQLQVDYLFQPFPNWYARLSAGIFEEMFGGVGAEVLYRPYGSRLAIGADINRVRQRDFDQRFDFRDYEVTTGHLNVYYNLPYMNLLAEIHAGRFLAGDWGSQFVLSRRFDTGVRIGAWATLTNVSAEDFGEGSFDKGFFVTIPFELFLPQSTRRGTAFAFRPLTRDGGQMLAVGPKLYGVVSEGSPNNVIGDWHRLLD